MWTFGSQETKYCAMDITELQRQVIMALLQQAVTSYRDCEVVGQDAIAVSVNCVMSLADYSAMRTALLAFKNVNHRD